MLLPISDESSAFLLNVEVAFTHQSKRAAGFVVLVVLVEPRRSGKLYRPIRVVNVASTEFLYGIVRVTWTQCAVTHLLAHLTVRFAGF